MKIKAVATALVHSLLLLAAAAVATLALANDQFPRTHADQPFMHSFNKYTVSVASNITIRVDILPVEAKELYKELVGIVPNGATIDPLGHTTVVFDVYYDVEINNSTRCTIVFLIPITTYMGLPITGPVIQTVTISPSTSIAVQGLTTSTTRLLYGISRQTFPRLSRVVISKISPDWPYPLTELTSFPVPALI